MAKTEQMPEYNLAKVEGGDLPDNAPSGRANLYLGLFQKIMTDPGEWYEVAYFKTPTGAKNAAKAIQAGDRPIPEGNWEIETRKISNPEDVAGSKHSKLFARYLGED